MLVVQDTFVPRYLHSFLNLDMQILDPGNDYAISLGCNACSAVSQLTCLCAHLNKSVWDCLELPEVWCYQKYSDTGRTKKILINAEIAVSPLMLFPVQWKS